MKRWHEDRDRMIRRWRIEIAKHEIDRYPYYALAPVPPQDCGLDDPCHCYRGCGFFRKRHPFDCGKARCHLCHWDKLTARRARSDQKRAAIRFDIMASA